jgi:RNA polymerase sigma-70 factor (ECF subfamily)
MIRNEALAEEIAHEIFIKVWNNREKLGEVVQPEAYMLTVASRHTLDHIRRRITEVRMLQRLSAGRVEGHNDTEEELLLRDRTALLAQAVEQLPPQQKAVYRMSRMEGLNYEEIGQRLQISSNTVRNHLVKALQSIREYMNDQDMLSVAILATTLFGIKK